MPDPDFTSADYELALPRDVAARELAALAATPGYRLRAQMPSLLREAFNSDEPRRAFAAAASDYAKLRFVATLLKRSNDFPASTTERPYWVARSASLEPAPDRDSKLRHRFARLVAELRATGYLDREFQEPCPADPDTRPADYSGVLGELLDQGDLWPLAPDGWMEETFFGLVEAFHDLASRPRDVERCSESDDCIGHFSDFSTETGRSLYRWRVNRLFAAAGSPLRLAADGEDVGRLVHDVDDARGDLLERALHSSSHTVGGRIAHAIALFRSRSATEHDRRSAVITLAGVLEERRELVRTEIGRKDEGALFTLANEFAIRHQRRGQHGDYDPAFLDWMFWWYLATIELTDQILARQASTADTSTS